MRVGLFVTCLVDLMRPSVGFAALRLLESAGCEVVVPAAQTCCGQPAFNAGDRGAARALARKLIDEFAGLDHVVLPSGSCAGMIRSHYAALFHGDAEGARAAADLAARTRELSEFLTEVVGLGRLSLPGSGMRLSYHDCCAGLRELGVKAQPRALLARLPDTELVEMDGAEDCCGFGGTFAVKFGDISAAIAARKCAQIRTSGAATVALGDVGCLLNIEGRLRREGDEITRVLHYAEVLVGE